MSSKLPSPRCPALHKSRVCWYETRKHVVRYEHCCNQAPNCVHSLAEAHKPRRAALGQRGLGSRPGSLDDHAIDPAFIGTARLVLADTAGRSRPPFPIDSCPVVRREGRTAALLSVVVSSVLGFGEDEGAGPRALLPPPLAPSTRRRHSSLDDTAAARVGHESTSGDGVDDGVDDDFDFDHMAVHGDDSDGAGQASRRARRPSRYACQRLLEKPFNRVCCFFPASAATRTRMGR